MGMTDMDIAHFIHAALLLALIGPAAWLRARGSRLQFAAGWLAIVVALSWGYQIFGIEAPNIERRMDAREAAREREALRDGWEDRGVDPADLRPESEEDI